MGSAYSYFGLDDPNKKRKSSKTSSPYSYFGLKEPEIKPSQASVPSPTVSPEPIKQTKKPSTWDMVKAGDIKGLANQALIGIRHGAAETGSAKMDEAAANAMLKSTLPSVQKYGQQQLARQQAEQNYLKANPVNSVPAMLGKELFMLPAWIGGERAVGAAAKGMGKLAPTIASKVEKLPNFIKGGLKDAATYGGVVAPIETIREGGGLQTLVEKERNLPYVFAGGTAIRGIGAGAKQALALRRARLEPTVKPISPLEEVQNTYRSPVGEMKLLPSGQDFTMRDVTTADRLRQMGVTNEQPLLPPGRIEPIKGQQALPPTQGFTVAEPYVAKTQIPKTEFERISSDYPQTIFSGNEFYRPSDFPSKEAANRFAGLEPSFKEASAWDKERFDTISNALNEERTAIYNEMANYLRTSGGKGVEQGGLFIDEFGDTVGRYGRISNNPKWYRDFYAEYGRKPSQKEIDALAEKFLREGYVDDAGIIPPNETYLTLSDDVKKLDFIKSIREHAKQPENATPPTLRLALSSGQDFILQGEPYRPGIQVPKTEFDVTPIQPSGFKTQIPKTEFDKTPSPPSGFKQTIEVPRYYDNSSQGLAGPVPITPENVGQLGKEVKPIQPPKPMADTKQFWTSVRKELVGKGEMPPISTELLKKEIREGKVDISGLGNEEEVATLLGMDLTKFGKKAEPVMSAKGEIPKGQVESGVSRNLSTDTARPTEMQDKYWEEPLSYTPVSNPESLAKAQAIFDEGLEPAISKLSKLHDDLSPEAPPLMKLIADKLYNEGNAARADELIAEAATRATQAGRYGQAYRILRNAQDSAAFDLMLHKQLNKLNKEGLEEYGKKWNNVELTPEEKELIGKIKPGDQKTFDSVFEQIEARIADQMPANAMEKINAWRHVSMLMNIKTNVRNVAGNAIMMGMRKGAQRASGLIQKVALPKSERTQAVLVDKEYKQLASEYFKANEKELFTSDAGKFQENIKLNMHNKRVFRKSRIAEKMGIDSKIISVPLPKGKKANIDLVDLPETIRKFNYQLLKWGDNPFFKNAYVDRLASYAQAKGIKDFSKLPQDAFDIARTEAEQATYKDANFIANFINRAKKYDKDASVIRKVGGWITEAAVPFAKTPMNIVSRGLQFSPLGIANGLAKIKSTKGAAAAIDEMAKGLTGTGIFGLGYILAQTGVLTGKAEKDIDLREYNKSIGHSPFSVLGKYSFDWAVPMSIPLSVGVEVFNAIKDSPEDVAKMNSLIEKNDTSKLQEIVKGVASGMIEGLNASGDVVFDMSVMKGIRTLLGSGTQGFMEGVWQLPQNYATQFIPTLSNQLAGTIDPIARTTYVKGDKSQSFKNAVVSRIPGASKTLQPKQTPFGEDVKRIENPIGRTLSQFVSPGIVAVDQKIDPKIDKELRRLNEYGLTKQFPTMVPGYIEKTQKHPRITLTPDETTQYQKRTGELTLSSFKKAMDKSSYANAKDSKKKNKTADEIRADILASAIEDARAQAKSEILKSKGFK